MKKIRILFTLSMFIPLNLWSQEKNTAVLTVNQYPDSFPEHMVLSTDRQTFFAIRENRYILAQASTGRILVTGTISSRGSTATNEAIFGISENLERIAFVNDADKNIHVINAFTRELIQTFKPEIPKGKFWGVNKIALTPDGKRIVTLGVKSGITVYDWSDAGKYSFTEIIPLDSVNQANRIQIAPDGRLLALAVSDEPGSILVFDLVNKKKKYSKGSGGIFTSGHETYIRSLYFSPDSRFLLSYDLSRKVFLHELAGGSKEIPITISSIYTVFNANISANGDVTFCTNSKFFPRHSICLPEESSASEPVKIDTKMKMRDLVGPILPNVLRQTQAESGAASAVASADKRTVMNTQTKKAVTMKPVMPIEYSMFDLATGTVKNVGSFVMTKGAVRGISANEEPEGELAVSNHDTLILSNEFGKINAIDFAGKILHECKKSDILTGLFMRFDYFEDKDLTAIFDNGYLMLYSDHCRHLIHAHEESGDITEMRFAISGNFLFVRTRNGILKIRDTKNLQTLATIAWAGPESWVVTSPDGRYDGKGEAMSALHYVTGKEIIQISEFDKSFFTPGLAHIILGEKNPHTKPVVVPTVKVEVKKSLVGKIHSIAGNDIVISGSSIKMGEKLFAVVNGKKIFLKVHFPTHSGAKTKAAKTSEQSRLAKGMPVFR